MATKTATTIRIRKGPALSKANSENPIFQSTKITAVIASKNAETLEMGTDLAEIFGL
jgi:hypothetical protein